MKYVAEWFDQYELRNKVSSDDGMKRVVLITLNSDESVVVNGYGTRLWMNI